MHNNDLHKLSIYPTFSYCITMKRNLKAKVKADVKVYLIPKDELKIENGKPILDDKYLVYNNTKKNKR